MEHFFDWLYYFGPVDFKLNPFLYKLVIILIQYAHQYLIKLETELIL